jgi:hypothetical protein
MNVVHCKRAKFDVLIDRSTRWGNPFVIDRDGTRDEVLQLYKTWVTTSQDAKARWIRQHVSELRGQILGCWCAPQPCHGDILYELANGG